MFPLNRELAQDIVREMLERYVIGGELAASYYYDAQRDLHVETDDDDEWFEDHVWAAYRDEQAAHYGRRSHAPRAADCIVANCSHACDCK